MFGGNTGVYIAVTRTAAAILGFNPWKELTKVFIKKIKHKGDKLC